ncbi:MAG: tyrosine-type recombinase/integrase [Ideonella sp.]|nr:tyrosine-type recombinase/integrase [Ideonella sp.]MCC7458021.1 tyrosine-type recombinase/integrase [Nitrospira sp.]
MTRYPKSGRGRRWTIVELKAIGAAWRGDSLADGDGLSGTVRTGDGGTVTVHWRYAFKREGRVAWHYCGTWPLVSLEAIRAARDAARDALKRGADPNEKRLADRIEERDRVRATLAADAQRRADDATLEELAREWLKSGVLRKDGNADLRRAFEKDIVPMLGSTPVRTLTEQHLRDALTAVVARGANRMSVRLWRDLRQMFAWAEKRQPWRRMLIDGNPAELVRIETIVPVDYDMSNVRERTLDAGEVRELRDIFCRMDASYESASDKRRAARPMQAESRLALWICLGTLCRIGELLMAEWKHVDLKAGTWFIPKENAKGARGKKQDQLVFLSAFSLGQFSALHALTGKTPWCFPSRDGESHIDVKTVTKQVGDRQHRFKDRAMLKGRRNDNSLVLARGANGDWTPNDLRRTGATMMQALGITPVVVDRCQNHVLEGSRVRRHYLTHPYNTEKREAWRRLGEEIEAILELKRPAKAAHRLTADAFRPKVIARGSPVPA